MLSKDGWGGLAVLAASLLLFGLTLGLKESALVPIGPGFYPRIVLGLTAALAFALVVVDRFSKKLPRAEAPADYRLVAAMFALFGLYVGSLPFLGFRIATFAYVAATNALLDFPKSARGWARAAAVALTATVLVYLAFERYLTVLLPRGRWTDF